MKFLAFRRDALEEIVSQRSFQSGDFAEADDFVRGLLTAKESYLVPNTKLKVHKFASGKIVVGRGGKDLPVFIIDLEQSNFLKIHSEIDQLIFVFQRLFRFAIKYWDKAVLTPAEQIVPPSHAGSGVSSASAKAVVFPFPISQKRKFRATIDLNPDLDRLTKRQMSGRFLLLYKYGDSDGGGASDPPSVANFRRFLECHEKTESDEFEDVVDASVDSQSSALREVSMDDLSNEVDIHQSYDTWMKLLTSTQRRFVTADMSSPSRIEGPAGTGKTACLAVAAVHQLIEAEKQKADLRIIFFTHSAAAKDGIAVVLQAMGADKFMSERTSAQFLEVATLQSYCAELLRQDISQAEFIDPDAYDAKVMQGLYVEEALTKSLQSISSFKHFMSERFADFIEQESGELLIPLIQHEIAVVIKSRANEKFEIYKTLPPIKAGLPLKTEGDRAFIWDVYKNYRTRLISTGQFDTDDVVLTALGQLSTPIWRRRRAKEGFDAIFIDETHLFNMNELSIFHHLTKTVDRFPIAFAVDKTQAIGDQGWNDDIDLETLFPPEIDASSNRVRVETVFRCAPDIVELAFSVTSSGASLFTNFENPLERAFSNMTYQQEKLAKKPEYIALEDSDLVAGAFRYADKLKDETGFARSEILICFFDEKLFAEAKQLAEFENKPAEFIQKRGDTELVEKAVRNQSYVLGMPDYVGGLEFSAVVLVGVDEGRVPANSSALWDESKAYLNYVAHNRLYVAITRAKYRILVIGSRTLGPSPILTHALSNDILIDVSK